MNKINTNIPGVWIIESSAFHDNRGVFSRFFCSRELQDIVGQRSIVQINYSRTYSVGAVRGLHYQNSPYAEMKIIRCLKGRVFDVAVDLRKDSQTFLQWTAIELTPESNKAFVIPEGFAHGFQVLEEDSQLLYLHTAPYNSAAEGALRFDEPRININWPLPATDLSNKDLQTNYITEDFNGVIV